MPRVPGAGASIKCSIGEYSRHHHRAVSQKIKSWCIGKDGDFKRLASNPICADDIAMLSSETVKALQIDLTAYKSQQCGEGSAP